MGLFDSLRRLFAASPEVSPTPMPSDVPPRAVPAMREHGVQCLGAQALHRMAYTEWGDPKNPRVLVCVHGLTRNGRDFDFLARALQDDYRVICPDVVGRGKSDWLREAGEYGFPQYLADMVTLIARLDVETVHWVGTSMGGLIGMLLAAKPASPITRLVMNDVGPVITGKSLKRIGEYVGNTSSFADLDEAEAYLRQTCAPFGPLGDEQWRQLTEHSVRGGADRLWLRYDPGIGEPFRKDFVNADVNLWPVYDEIHCPTLVVRGAESDLLARETALEMSQRGPRAKLVEVPGVGHAPMFMNDAQVGILRDFLLAEAGKQA
ncbi:MAG: alpha/beta hydrolase [Rhodocyclaceae bacterium]|nr:alpha/beta hydrolase [Rhodocyclaceae bacterium]